jgi:hypothetical protein
LFWTGPGSACAVRLALPTIVPNNARRAHSRYPITTRPAPSSRSNAPRTGFLNTRAPATASRVDILTSRSTTQPACRERARRHLVHLACPRGRTGTLLVKRVHTLAPRGLPGPACDGPDQTLTRISVSRSSQQTVSEARATDNLGVHATVLGGAGGTQRQGERSTTHLVGESGDDAAAEGEPPAAGPVRRMGTGSEVRQRSFGSCHDLFAVDTYSPWHANPGLRRPEPRVQRTLFRRHFPTRERTADASNGVDACEALTIACVYFQKYRAPLAGSCSPLRDAYSSPTRRSARVTV